MPPHSSRPKATETYKTTEDSLFTSIGPPKPPRPDLFLGGVLGTAEERMFQADSNPDADGEREREGSRQR